MVLKGGIDAESVLVPGHWQVGMKDSHQVEMVEAGVDRDLKVYGSAAEERISDRAAETLPEVGAVDSQHHRMGQRDSEVDHLYDRHLDPVLSLPRSRAKLTRRVESLRRVSRSCLRLDWRRASSTSWSIAVGCWTRAGVLCCRLCHRGLEKGLVVATGFDELLIKLLEVI